MSSYRYITENFLTRADLLAVSGVSDENLTMLITSGCFPKPSYRVEVQAKIESFFGVHNELEELEFFPKAAADLLINLMVKTGGSIGAAASLKQDFFEGYKVALIELQAADYGLSHLFETDGHTLAVQGEEFLNQEWQHYLDGTYGVCTNTAQVSDIATKEAMIARIKFLCTEIDAGRANDNRDKLAQAVSMLDSVSAPFAPHEVERSSREKFINRIRRDYLSG